jgi:hypothetical protein
MTPICLDRSLEPAGQAPNPTERGLPDGIVTVTIVWRNVTQYDEIVAGSMTQYCATPSTKPTVSVCRFHG